MNEVADAENQTSPQGNRPARPEADGSPGEQEGTGVRDTIKRENQIEPVLSTDDTPKGEDNDRIPHQRKQADHHTLPSKTVRDGKKKSIDNPK